MVGPFSTPQTQKKSSFFESKCRKLQFLKLSKKSYFWVVFLTKTTVLTSILTFEVTDMVPQPQFELGKVPETQSGTWGNLVPHMCKSQQTTSVKIVHLVIPGGRSTYVRKLKKEYPISTNSCCTTIFLEVSKVESFTASYRSHMLAKNILVIYV